MALSKAKSAREPLTGIISGERLGIWLINELPSRVSGEIVNASPA